jgi:hypothetical protein
MNNPESLVTSLALSKELKEAGWEQDNLFIYVQKQPEKKSDTEHWDIWRRNTTQVENVFDWLSAPTAEEILRILPDIIDERAGLLVYRDRGDWCVAYEWIPNGGFRNLEVENSLANAAAQCWLYLKKNNLLPSEK